jgi:hypothetical protein
LRDEPLASKVPKIALHPRAVAGIVEFCEVFDAHHAELANLRERADF